MELKIIHDLGVCVEYFSDLKVKTPEDVRKLSRAEFKAHLAQYRKFFGLVAELYLACDNLESYERWSNIIKSSTGALCSFRPQVKFSIHQKTDFPVKKMMIQFYPDNFRKPKL